MDLRAFTPDELKKSIAKMGQPAYRAEQVFRFLHDASNHGPGAPTKPSNVSNALWTALTDDAANDLPRLTIDTVQKSSDGTRKYAFRTHDGKTIESVLIPNDNDDQDRLTLCISSQVGCALDCQFCATAKLGFGRHLTPGEIVQQVYLATQEAGRRPTNLVFMGMGEPLHNADNVIRAFQLLLHPWGAHFSPRRITVSTVGLIPGIDKLAQLNPAPNLTISLNAPNDTLRTALMPITKKYSVDQLFKAARDFPLAHGRRLTFGYVLLGGLNDGAHHARELAQHLQGMRAMINLIPWNPFEGPGYDRPSKKAVLAFQAILLRAGVQAYIRTPRGVDIDAACGQLAARKRDAATGEKQPIVPLRLQKATQPTKAQVAP